MAERELATITYVLTKTDIKGSLKRFALDRTNCRSL
jgi:hypothetical protein